jgi:hypothetical protein
MIHPSVRNVIAGRSRSETPQAVPDGLLDEKKRSILSLEIVL